MLKNNETMDADAITKDLSKLSIGNNSDLSREELILSREELILSREELILSVFKPDENGYSHWISVEEIIKSGLPWTTNGNCRHGVYFSKAGKKYIWEKKSDKSNNRTIAIRTIGFSDDFLYGASRPIKKEIRDYYRRIACVSCGATSSLVVDHKNDLYNDPRVLSTDTQTLDDFQSLCTHCNLQKREISKKTKESGLRYGATRIPKYADDGIDFISGDETFDASDVNAMVGTYWYDPVEFHKQITLILLQKMILKLEKNNKDNTELNKEVKSAVQTAINELLSAVQTAINELLSCSFNF